MSCTYFGRTRTVFTTWVRPLFWLAMASIPAAGQVATAPPLDPGLRISVDVKLVVLSVSVRDKRGAAVPRLEEHNFRVEENGRPQAIRSFRAGDSPVAVGLVVDSSHSMRSKRPEVVAAAAAFARLSNPRDELFIANFNEKVAFSFPDTKLLAASPAELAGALLNPIAIGRTALYDAVAAALAHIRTSRIERKVLLVISDGGDNASRTTRRDLLREVSAAGVEIYTIGLFDEADSEVNPGVLRRIAESSGGLSFRPNTSDEAIRMCEQIAADIRAQYVISYSPSNQNFCGEYRAIRLRVSTDRGGKLAARTRPGYIAEPSAGRCQ